MKNINILLISLFCFFSFFPKSGFAIPIFGSGPLSSFTGDFDYAPISEFEGTLTVTLTNTSPYEVFLTAFAFNNPNGDITGVTLENITHFSFLLLGGSNFNNGINAQPFGDFDIGAGLGGQFQGGGSPNDGIINQWETGDFTFNLTGTNLNMLTTGSFLSELSMPRGTNNPEFFIARFRGPAGSNKAPGSPVPEPSTLLLLGSGLVAMAGVARSRRRK